MKRNPLELSKNKGMRFLEPDRFSGINDDYNKYTFASLKNYDIIHFQQTEEQGSDESKQVISKAILAHQPDGVILLGIAWGKGDRQKIGDILVSNLIVDANHGVAKDGKLIVDTECVFRTGSEMVKGIKRLKSSWKNANSPKLYIEPIVSSNIYSASPEKKKELLSSYPYIIGGEMEGAGAARACIENGLHEYIIIKAISDWGDGLQLEDDNENSKNRKIAAKNASLFLLYLLQEDGFAKVALNVNEAIIAMATAHAASDVDGILNHAFRFSSPIKKAALRMIDLKDAKTDRYTTWVDLNRDFIEFKSSQRWQAAQKLFEMLAELRDVSDVSDRRRIDVPKNAFSWLRNKITISNKNIPVIIKGEPKLGKSTLMGLFFAYLLDKYASGDLLYLPFYFNKEKSLRHNDNRDSKDDIEQYFSEIEAFCEQHAIQALFLVDGLTNSEVFDDSVENACWIKANEKSSQKKKDKRHKYVFAIDDYSNISKQLTNVGTRESVDIIVYINQINTINEFKQDNRIDLFISTYAQLYDRNKTSQNRAIKHYKLLNLPYIDYNTISIFEYQLFGNSEESITDLYSDFFARRVTLDEQNALLEQAFLIFSDDNIEYSNYKSLISENVFKLVVEQYGLLQYLVARQYATAIINGNFAAQVLNVLFDKQIATFVLDLLEKNQQKRNLIRQIEALYENLTSYCGRSSLSYLVGRLGGIDNPMKVLNTQQSILFALNDTSDKQASTLDYDYKAVAQRSICISKIVLNTATNTQVLVAIFNYLEILFSDSYQCMINRAFHRWYYNDISWKVFETHHDAVGVGFDFRNSFHNLAKKLRHSLKKAPDAVRDPLVEINLFTLCNLFQTRIETPWAQIIKGKYKTEYESTNLAKIRKTFLYDEHRLKYSVYLKAVVEYIDEYLDEYILGTDNIAYNAFISYIKMMRSFISDFLSGMKNESYGSSDRIYKTFDTLHKLFQMRRMGWNITSNKAMASDEYNDIVQNTPIYETISEHILSAFWIGMFFLPDNTLFEGFFDKTYNKQEVLNTILLHDLGESSFGDWSQLCDQYDKVKKSEDDYTSEMFSLGTFSYFGSTYNNFRLWKQWAMIDSGGNVNVKIAKDIDIIQMLYKLMSMKEMNTNEPYFDTNRYNSFLDDAEKIETTLGRIIFQRLIKNHPTYSKHFNRIEAEGTQKTMSLSLEAFTINPKKSVFVGRGYGSNSNDISDIEFDVINRNPRSITKQIIDGRIVLLINLCASNAKRQTIKVVKAAAVLSINLSSSHPITRLVVEDTFTIKSSADDCYEIEKLYASFDFGGIKRISWSLPIVYAYIKDGEAPPLNCERLRELSRSRENESPIIDILKDPEQADDILNFSSMAFLFKMTMLTGVDEEESQEYTLAFAKDDDGILKSDNGYIFDAAHFSALALEHNRVCGKAVSWKEQSKRIARIEKRTMVIVATQIELEMALETIGQLEEFVPISIGKQTGLVCHLKNCSICILKCQQRSGGVGGSTLTLFEAIRDFNPNYVIMSGIAFGSDPTRQSIGDVIISSQVWEYDIEKISEDVSIPRGSKYSASAYLLQMFDIAKTKYPKISYQSGLVASGGKLSDRKIFIDYLKSHEPEIIGGEMEAAGVAAACDRARTDWIIVKGICDWGYNKNNSERDKDQDQKTAARNAMTLVKEVLLLICLNNR